MLQTLIKEVLGADPEFEKIPYDQLEINPDKYITKTDYDTIISKLTSRGVKFTN